MLKVGGVFLSGQTIRSRWWPEVWVIKFTISSGAMSFTSPSSSITILQTIHWSSVFVSVWRNPPCVPVECSCPVSGKENDNFIKCCPSTFDWKTRRWRVLEEIIRHDPDIICLQEVDHPKLMFKALQSVGYSGRFLHKPDSPCVYLPNNNGPDGCAVFFKTSKFDLFGWATRILKVWDVASNQVVWFKYDF